MSELQRIVDSLAQSTKRAVSVQDRNRTLLAHSSHLGAIDEIRKETILTRRGPSRGFSWARSFGIEKSETPLRIPPNEEVGMVARVCAPIRSDGKLLGFLWLIDPEESLPDEAMDLVKSASDAAALAIQQEELMQQLDRGRERELLRDLLSDQADVRQHAVDELVERKLLIPSDLVVALVVRPVRDRSGMSPADTTVRGRVERVLTRARHRVAPRQALHLVRPDHGVLLVTCATHHLGTVEDVAAELHKYTSESVAGDGSWKAFVGIGDPQKDLADSHESYTQARKTAEVAGLLNLGGAVAKWSDLGVYQTLVQLPLSEVDTRSLHPGLAKLFGARDSEIWLKTLECYLDMGCDARGAARTLFINRGSLYHRIHRIEEIADVSLGNGDDRLALHLGLKLARLAGLLDGSSPA